jgi:hypothetical protein
MREQAQQLHNKNNTLLNQIEKKKIKCQMIAQKKIEISK